MIKDTDTQTKNKLSYEKFNLRMPTLYIPSPTKGDYNSAFIDRYFIKKINDNKIMEVDPKNYNTVGSDFFTKVQIRWQIRGSQTTIYNGKILVQYGVGEYNRRQISNAEKALSGIKNYLTDYFQFWIGY